MTKQEASQRYSIPLWLLDEYESWGLCQEGQYGDSDLERLSMILTLHDVGFTVREVEAYMRLLQEGGSYSGAENADAQLQAGSCVGGNPL